MRRALPLLALLWASPASAADSPALRQSDEVFVLSLGYPHAPDKESLRYPAWDAARFVETVAGVHDPDGRARSRYALLADFRNTSDRDLFAHHALRPPTRRALERAVEDLNRQMDALRPSGKRPVLLVFYAGHGEVGEGNMGRVFLRPEGQEPGPGQGEALSANDLRQLVLERARAERIHLFVDACNAYFLMKSRGRVPSSRQSRRQGRLGRRFAQRLPGVGVVLSTSGVANVYESRTLQGGLFSHVLRSALSGAADLDGDGAVSYDEIAGFYDEAFAGVVNRDRFSPEVYVQPPREDAGWSASWAQASVLGLPKRPGQGVELLAGQARHIFVTDARGLRLAEIHHDGATPLRLWLPAPSVRGSESPLVVHQVDEGRATALGAVPPGAGWQRPAEGTGRGLEARGVTEDVVRQMFARPTGRSRLAQVRAAVARARLEGRSAERTRDRYFGMRLSGGATGRAGGELEGLGVAPTVGVALRRESARLVLGGAATFVLPTRVEAGQETVSTWAGVASARAGWAMPAGVLQLEPHALLGGVARVQDGDRGAYGLRAGLGVGSLFFLPWDTDWAFALETQAAAEYVFNVIHADGSRGGDLGAVWTVTAGADFEVPR